MLLLSQPLRQQGQTPQTLHQYAQCTRYGTYRNETNVAFRVGSYTADNNNVLLTALKAVYCVHLNIRHAPPL
jgi:hypothetical protein